MDSVSQALQYAIKCIAQQSNEEAKAALQILIDVSEQQHTDNKLLTDHIHEVVYG